MEAGLVFFASTTSATTPETGESVIPLTFTKMCDIQNASLEYTKGEIEVTTLCDAVKVYRGGLVDASGSLEGVTTLGITDEAGGIIEKFITTVKQLGDLSSVTVSRVNEDAVFLQLEVNKESTDGEDVAFYFFPATLLSYTAGITTGDNAQTFSSNFRITTDDDIEPQFFELEQPVI